MDALELRGDILLPGGQLETPGLVISYFYLAGQSAEAKIGYTNSRTPCLKLPPRLHDITTQFQGIH